MVPSGVATSSNSRGPSLVDCQDFVECPAVRIGAGIPFARKSAQNLDLNRLHRVLDLLQRRMRNSRVGQQNAFKSVVMASDWSGAVGERNNGQVAREVGARPVHKRIKPADLINYIGRIGYHVNIDEAKYLIGMVDENKAGTLGQKEFSQLLYVNTNKVLPPRNDPMQRAHLMKSLIHLADRRQHLNQAFLDEDPHRKYHLTKKEFDRAMKRALPHEGQLANILWHTMTHGKKETCDWRKVCRDVTELHKRRLPGTPHYAESMTKLQFWAAKAKTRLLQEPPVRLRPSDSMIPSPARSPGNMDRRERIRPQSAPAPYVVPQMADMDIPAGDITPDAGPEERTEYRPPGPPCETHDIPCESEDRVRPRSALVQRQISEVPMPQRPKSANGQRGEKENQRPQTAVVEEKCQDIPVLRLDRPRSALAQRQDTDTMVKIRRPSSANPTLGRPRTSANRSASGAWFMDRHEVTPSSWIRPTRPESARSDRLLARLWPEGLAY